MSGRTVVTVVAISFLAVLMGTAEALPAYTVDGRIEDWNVQLKTDTWNWWFLSLETINQDSFRPDPQGDIDFSVEDYWLSDNRPVGGEVKDYEALYLDDVLDYLYIGVIASHPWDESSTLWLEANDVRIQAADFDEFAWDRLDVTERIGIFEFPNYFYEGAVLSHRFGDLTTGDAFTAYANCGSGWNWCCESPADSITGSADIDSPVHAPEPGTAGLVALGVIGLVARLRRKRDDVTPS